MHRLLQRQIKKHFGNLDSIPSEWQGFLDAIDEAYCQYDDDHKMIERSLELSSEELLQANHQLRVLLTTVEGQVSERTLELTKANLELEKALIDLQNTQVHLIQAEKMSSLGQLIAGIAHEINNPVNFIHGNLNYLGDYTRDLLKFVKSMEQCCPVMTKDMRSLAEEIDLNFIQDDLPKIIKSMEVGTKRIREIVLSLRNFSHMDEVEFKRVDIHQGLDDTLLILDHRLRFNANAPDIQIIKQYGDLPLISCYPGQLNQVFVNILANAIDALEESQLQANAQTANDYVSPFIRIQTKLISDRYVEIAIIDNGGGIPEEIQQKIFNPFFTTKPVGKGTGMGMAISYQIVTEKHQGKLTCTSVVGKGTNFSIQIPIAM
ncbi:HAMP domain-containing histidine kinase [Pseudanabaena sp. FACHB-1998]|uniref:sensor histidine kinase n=1 Tax=Pseudanabaena sp. FACHB-1998 TaxID=2692858 RepID=UPI001681BBD4|nr:ATP-binding protein [Pseudanabaena sp. FACHB-1998]MBD2176422.1 HAMP domain-containing histidine kinase [Pseudanabaena sp. FACHB-1998]